MKSEISYTSDWNNKRKRFEEINTIEELISLIKKENNMIIIDIDFNIEIYDGYREY